MSFFGGTSTLLHYNRSNPKRAGLGFASRPHDICFARQSLEDNGPGRPRKYTNRIKSMGNKTRHHGQRFASGGFGRPVVAVVD